MLLHLHLENCKIEFDKHNLIDYFQTEYIERKFIHIQIFSRRKFVFILEKVEKKTNENTENTKNKTFH